MSIGSLKQSNDPLVIKKSNRALMFNRPGSTTSFPSSLVSSGTTNKGNEVRMLSPICIKFELKFFAQFKMVGKQPGTIKLKTKQIKTLHQTYIDQAESVLVHEEIKTMLR